jgi:hypothetical protein
MISEYSERVRLQIHFATAKEPPTWMRFLKPLSANSLKGEYAAIEKLRKRIALEKERDAAHPTPPGYRYKIVKRTVTTTLEDIEIE